MLGAHATAAAPAELNANNRLKKQICLKTQTMNELASKKDFVGAATVQAEVDELTKSRSKASKLLEEL